MLFPLIQMVLISHSTGADEEFKVRVAICQTQCNFDYWKKEEFYETIIPLCTPREHWRKQRYQWEILWLEGNHLLIVLHPSRQILGHWNWHHPSTWNWWDIFDEKFCNFGAYSWSDQEPVCSKMFWCYLCKFLHQKLQGGASLCPIYEWDSTLEFSPNVLKWNRLSSTSEKWEEGVGRTRGGVPLQQWRITMTLRMFSIK